MRAYQADPYKPLEEREKGKLLISTAYRALTCRSRSVSKRCARLAGRLQSTPNLVMPPMRDKGDAP